MGRMGNSFQKFGQVLKGGGAREPEEVDAGHPGPTTGGNALPGAIRYGVQPIPQSYSHRLFLMTALTSPAVAGRFRDQLGGAGENDPRDMGALQTFRGAYSGPMNVRLGAQAGPSSQPGFPSTNNDPTVFGLGQMDLPTLWRNKGATLQ